MLSRLGSPGAPLAKFMTLTMMGRTSCGVELVLVPPARHPGAGALRGPREVVGQEQPDVAAVLAGHFEAAHVGMIHGQVGALLEAHPEQLVGNVEGSGDHVVELQVGLHLCFVDIEQGLAHFLGVVAPVPARQLEVAALGLHGACRWSRSSAARFTRGLPHLHQQLAHVGWRLGHGEFECRVGRGLEAEQARAFGPQVQNFGDDLAIVGFAAVGAALPPGLEGLLAQVAARRELQERLDARAGQADRVLALVATLVAVCAAAARTASGSPASSSCKFPAPADSPARPPAHSG